MKKVFKLSIVSLIALFALVTLVGCGAGITEKFADKINEKVSTEECYTYEQLVEKLGEPTEKAVVAGTGLAVWVDGYETLEEIADALEDGKTIKSLSVTFLAGKATHAEYEEVKE